ncbi:MAG TPA: M14 family metallopeptidase [Thermoanaerobaculia bacterium]
MPVRLRRPSLLACSFLLAAALAPATLAAAEPPVAKEWLTPAEIADFEATPNYAETMAFLRRLEARLPEMRLTTFGTSGEGRPLPLVVLSKEHAFTPEAAVKTGKPVVLIQNGIHAGEIDGKDACLLILRDLAIGRRRELLDAATILVVPMYNADGHERISPYNRPNQDGPKRGMGFRTNTAGLDLNRDYLKLDAPESRALMTLVNAWRPHLHVDDHVTDGVDHDWTLTWSYAEAPQVPAPVDGWLRAHMPAAFAATEKAGHKTGPYVDLKDANDPTKGFSSWVGQPHYSTGYFPLRNRPSILVETHSYKPYKARVLANRDFLLALLAEVGKEPQALLKAVTAAEATEVAMGRSDALPSEIAVRYDESESSDPIKFPVYAWDVHPSVVQGTPVVSYHRGEVKEIEVPWFHRPRIGMSLPRPRGYLVLPGWPQIEARLRGHGLTVERVTEPAEIAVETIRVDRPEYQKAPYQGLTRLTAAATRKREARRIPAGALWIPADQPDFEVAVQLLEPEAADSLLSWGLLSTVFEQKEYMSPFVLEKWAQDKLKDAKTAADWQRALEDPAFAADATARYRWWFSRTPNWDSMIGLLPYFRVMSEPHLPTVPWR